MQLPDEKVMCHRTGFEKTCFDMVTRCKCRAWVRIEGRDLNGKPIDLYDCADAWAPQIAQQSTAQLSQQLTTIAQSVDALRHEVRNGKDAATVDMISDLNARVRSVTALPQKLTGT